MQSVFDFVYKIKNGTHGLLHCTESVQPGHKQQQLVGERVVFEVLTLFQQPVGSGPVTGQHGPGCCPVKPGHGSFQRLQVRQYHAAALAGFLPVCQAGTAVGAAVHDY